jgi:hypothetical protein
MIQRLNFYCQMYPTWATRLCFSLYKLESSHIALATYEISRSNNRYVRETQTHVGRSDNVWPSEQIQPQPNKIYPLQFHSLKGEGKISRFKKYKIYVTQYVMFSISNLCPFEQWASPLTPWCRAGINTIRWVRGALGPPLICAITPVLFVQADGEPNISKCFSMSLTHWVILTPFWTPFRTFRNSTKSGRNFNRRGTVCWDSALYEARSLYGINTKQISKPTNCLLFHYKLKQILN